MDLRSESTDYRMELLSPMRIEAAIMMQSTKQSWRINISEFEMPQVPKDHSLGFFVSPLGKRSKIAKYYKKQQKLLEGLKEMESFIELGCLEGAPTQDDLKQQANSERMAVNLSNIANLVLFAAKVYASIESKSLAVIASTLDSLLDLLSGFILWCTAYAMKKPNQFIYPIGKKRMQPVGIIVFASVMATLGLQVLLESGRQLLMQSHPAIDKKNEKWMIGIMTSVTIVKFVLMLYCRSFKNEIVRAYAQDHSFDVMTNSMGLVAALLAIRFYWWIDPVGAIMVMNIHERLSCQF